MFVSTGEKKIKIIRKSKKKEKEKRVPFGLIYGISSSERPHRNDWSQLFKFI